MEHHSSLNMIRGQYKNIKVGFPQETDNFLSWIPSLHSPLHMIVTSSIKAKHKKCISQCCEGIQFCQLHQFNSLIHGDQNFSFANILLEDHLQPTTLVPNAQDGNDLNFSSIFWHLLFLLKPFWSKLKCGTLFLN